MDPNMGEIPLEIPQDGRQPAGGNAVLAADGQFSLFQALQAGTAFLDLSGPVQQFPDGRQQVLPFQSQLHTLGTALVLEGGIFLPARALTWESLIFQILVCSCFGFTFQPVAQQAISAEETGMYCAINPLFASLLGHWVFGEAFGPTAILGAVYILTGLAFVNWPKKMQVLPEKASPAQQLADCHRSRTLVANQ